MWIEQQQSREPLHNYVCWVPTHMEIETSNRDSSEHDGNRIHCFKQSTVHDNPDHESHIRA